MSREQAEMALCTISSSTEGHQGSRVPLQPRSSSSGPWMPTNVAARRPARACRIASGISAGGFPNLVKWSMVIRASSA